MVEVDASAVADGTPSAEERFAQEPKPSLRRNLAHLMSSQLLTWVFATVVSVILPRYLGPENIGQLRLAGAVWTMAQLFVALGTSTYLTLEIARDRERGARLVGPIIVLRTIAFACSVVVLAVIGAVTGVDHETTIVFCLLGAVVWVWMIADVAGAALNGLEQMSYPAKAAVISKVLYTGFIVAVVLLGGDVRAVAAAGLPGAAVSLVILWTSFRRFGHTTFHRPFDETRAIIRASKVFLALGAVLVVYQQIDTVVISALVEPEVLGWYSTADTLFGTLLFVPTILMTVLLPRFSRLHAEDPPALQQLVSQSLSSLTLVAVPIGLGTAVIADNFAVLLYGEAYRETGPVLAVLGIVVILTFGTMLLGGLAAATGRQRTWNLVMIAAIVASIPLDIVLVPWTDDRYGNGAIGGALAYVITESAMLAFGLWTFAREMVNRALTLRIGKILAAGGLMVIATWPLRNVFIAIPIVVGAVVYATATVVFRTLTDEEAALIRQALSRLRASRRATPIAPNG